MKKVQSALIVVFGVLVLSMGLAATEYPEKIESVLAKAGSNASELKHLLEHYREDNDTLKYQAACFLVGNMVDHSYVTYIFVDTSGAEVPFDISVFPDYDSLLVSADSIERERGEMDYQRDTIIYDRDVISAEFLIEHIDLAFQVWRGLPWSQAYSFENFQRYILPYRGSNEPLESWRRPLVARYADLAAEMKNAADPIEAASLINDDVRSFFGFDPRYYYHPTDQGLSEMLASGLGRCEDMTNITIYALRANGLAVTSDYTPHWANANNNHAWNSIATADGTVIPFMGAEANPGKYKLRNRAAKVYRKLFEVCDTNLVFQDRLQEKIPRWLKGKSYCDVTELYGDVTDVTIALEKQVPDSVDIAYLCVFNSGSWRAIDWGRINGSEVTFYKMGRDIVYLPALYINEEIVPYGAPFLLDKEGVVQYLRADNEHAEPMQLTATTRPKRVASTDGTLEVHLDSGVVYELQYWKDGWQTVGEAAAGDDPIEFESVPLGGLYWLTAKDSNRKERIFTWENDQQAWR